MKRSKRFLAIILASIVLFLHCTANVQAAPASSDYYTYTAAAYSRLNELGTYLGDSTGGQYGLLYRVAILSEYAMYIDFLVTYQSELGVTGSELKNYQDSFYTECWAFDSLFGNKESKKYTALQLEIPKESKNDAAMAKSSAERLLTKTVPQYLEQLLKEASDKSVGLKKTELSQTYGVLLSNVYSVLEVFLMVPEDIKNLTPYKTGTTHLPFGDTYVKLAQGLQESYSSLCILGKEVQQKSGEEVLTVDNTKRNPIENLADVVSDSKSGIQIPADPKLSLAYLAIFSASSVYTPLQSYTGSEEFLSALTALARDTSTAEELKIFYNKTKDFRKPLYYRKLNASGKTTGAAELVTMKEFFSMIESGGTGALCTVEGKFSYNAPATTWVYEKDDTILDNSDVEDSTVEDVSGENTDNSLEQDVAYLDCKPDNLANIKKKAKESLLSVFTGHSVLYAAGITTPPTTGSTEETSSENKEVVTTVETNVQEQDTADISKQLPATALVTDENCLTNPVLLFGSKYSRDTDNLTTVLLTNILKSTSNLNKLKDTSSRYLYLNAYGDIVTDDNLVLLPASSNPIYFDLNKAGYNPFTVAFMNYYPKVLQSTNFFQLVSKSDIGKYVIVGKSDTKSAKDGDMSYYASSLTAINTLKSSAPLVSPTINKNFLSNGGYDTNEVFDEKRLIFGAEEDWSEKNSLYSYSPLVEIASLTIEGDSVFPYDSNTDTTFSIAQAIAANMYSFLTYDTVSSKVTNLGRLHDNYMLHYIVISGMNGTNNPQGYANSNMFTYSKYVSESANRKVQTLIDFSKSLYTKTTDVDGVIGLRSSYQDEILGSAFSYVRENWVIFLVIYVLILLFAFAKLRRDLLQTTVLLVTTIGVAYLFVNIIPVYLPMLFNTGINNIAERLTYEVLGVKTEYYDADDSSMVTLDEDGKYKFNTTSLTLYRIASKDLQDFYNSLNKDESEGVAGNTVIVNQESGLFAEGDSLKINTDLLFDTLKIVSEVPTGGSTYHLQSYKTVSNNVDYYTPYYQIIDTVLGKLNTLADVYAIPRTNTSYVGGVSKSNGLVYSYVNSRPFLTPGNYTFSPLLDTSIMTNEEVTQYESNNANVTDSLEEAFGSNVDWLGISEFLYNPTKETKATLWMQTLQDRGYYDSKWDTDEYKMDALITYVNYQTKKFVYSMTDQIGSLSDDVMVKLISLRALVAINQKASDFGHWLYPFSLNYEELTLGDIMSCMFTDNYNTYVEMNMDVVEYIATNYGWFHLIAFDLLVVLLFLTVHIVRLAVPIMYLAIGLLLLYKLIAMDDLKVPLKGYLKSSLVVLLSATGLCLGIIVTKKCDESAIGIYLLLGIVSLILFVIISLLISVILNFTDFGNTSITVSLQNKLSLVEQSLKIRANNIQYHNNRVSNYDANSHRADYRDRRRRYGMESRMQDFYGHSSARHHRQNSSQGRYEGVAPYEKTVTDTTTERYVQKPVQDLRTLSVDENVRDML